MDFLLTFLEGIITFVSPCILPMLPIYLAYFAGDAGAAGERDLRRTLICAAGFVLGFGLVFTVLGAFAGALGSLLLRYQRAVDIVCGAVVIVLGLNYLGVLRIAALDRTGGIETAVRPRTFLTSLAFGAVFGLSWTPCVGAFLASALSLAVTSGSLAAGIALLACYSLGLGVPFIISAVLIDQLEGAFTWVKAHYAIIDRVCGALLVVVGALMATGQLGLWLRLLA